VVRREPLIDFRSAQSAHLDGMADSEVLAFAAKEGRVLISHDLQTMPGHFRNFVQRGRCPGVLLIRQDLPVGAAVASLVLVWEASDASEWENRLCVVPSLVTIAMRQA